MSAAKPAKEVVRWTPSPVQRLLPPGKGGEQPIGFLHPLVESMVRIKNTGHARGVFVFTGPARGVGTSFVVQMVAQQLADDTGARVMIAPSSALPGLTPAYLNTLPRGCVQRGDNVWCVVDGSDLEGMSDAALDDVWVSVVPRDFEFLLVDCPPVRDSGDALRLSPEADAVFLVVAAGVTTHNQIEQAQKLLALTSDRLQGIVLNRRTYPVPGFIYRWL